MVLAEIWTELLRLVSLRDYNTRVVLLGTMVLGMCAGVVGVFMLMRKRALLGDVVSHAALPGIALAFMLAEYWAPGQGKSLALLLTGAAVSGVAGVFATTLIRRTTRLKDDAALAIVLSVFFGIGISLLTVIQRLPSGNAAGLSHFIYGKAASMMASDVQGILFISLIALLVCALLFKEFTVLCFDERFAQAQGWPTFVLDQLLMALVVTVAVIGLQSVGLLLVVALLIVPAAAARFWTERLSTMVWIAGALGGVSSLIGVAISAVIPRVATGATIVLVGAFFFGVSLLLGTQRGLLPRWVVRARLRRRTGVQHVLRSLYEIAEQRSARHEVDVWDQGATFQELLEWRGWTERELRRKVRRAANDRLVRVEGERVVLTESGREQAARVVHHHRLWELYLIHYAHVAPAHVDRGADEIEHVLDTELRKELERRLADALPEEGPPQSPHPL